jgi:hypothetical protein
MEQVSDNMTTKLAEIDEEMAKWEQTLKDIRGTQLLSRHEYEWTFHEYATEVHDGKNMWKDVPQHMQVLLDKLTPYSWATRPEDVARTMVDRDMTMSELNEYVSFFVENAGHGFTWFSKGHYVGGNYHHRRYRMTKKPMIVKVHDYSVKGLAANIQSNRFWVSTYIFGEGAVSMDNRRVQAWLARVATLIPKEKLERIEQNENLRIAEVEARANKYRDINKRLFRHIRDIDDAIAKALEDVFDVRELLGEGTVRDHLDVIMAAPENTSNGKVMEYLHEHADVPSLDFAIGDNAARSWKLAYGLTSQVSRIKSNMRVLDSLRSKYIPNTQEEEE